MNNGTKLLRLTYLMNKVTSKQLVPSGGTLSVSVGITSRYIFGLSDAEYIPACGSLFGVD